MILSPQSQLLERNIALFDEGQWAFINPSDAYFLDGLKSQEVTVIHQYFDIFSECVRVVPSVSFDSRDITRTGFEGTQKVGNHTHIFTFITKFSSLCIADERLLEYAFLPMCCTWKMHRTWTRLKRMVAQQIYCKLCRHWFAVTFWIRLHIRAYQ